jgi:hypothetical protein
MILLLALACTSELAPVDLPARAPAIALLARQTNDRIELVGATGGDLHIDIDGPTDDRYAFRTQLLRSGTPIWERTTPGPVIVRDFLDYYSADANIDILGAFPSLGEFAVQVPLLDNASTVVFQIRQDDGTYLEVGRYDMPTELDPVSPTVVGSATLHDSGPSDNRLDITIVGDGYTEAQLADYRADADALTATLLGVEPFARHADRINVHRVDAVSAESGASYDCVDGCGMRDTAFGSLFALELVNQLQNTNYSTRAVFQIDQFEVARAASATPWDFVLVLVNTPKFGGMAVHWATATTSGNDWTWTGVHELAHTVGLLGDEYTGDNCIRSAALGLPDNVTDTPESPPWLHWVEADTPLPTPSLPENDDKVGAFLPAYNCADLYRPQRHCLMRDETLTFCAVCSELLVRRFFRYSDAIETAAVESRTVTLTGMDADATWLVDGLEYTTLPLTTPFTAPRGTKELEVRVGVVDPFVRDDGGDLLEVRRWSTNP